MSLVAHLGYELPERNLFHGAVAAAFGTRAGGWLGYRIASPLDRAVSRLTGGKSSVTEWFSGVPPIWLTSIGAQSGRERRTPLFGIPFEADLALIGTGFGQSPTPAWVYNLEANPQAAVEFRDRSADVLARPTNMDEASVVWDAGNMIYPGFARYRERVRHRDVRLFILERALASGG